jgi:ribosome biogenesis GTPase
MEGQIVKILSNLYTVNSNGKIYECHSRGKFRNNKITPMVGDYVKFDSENKYILEILPRLNELERPLVSNIDQGLIVTSLKGPDFSTNLLDKLLVVMEHHKIKPIICLTKNDLLNNNEKKEIKRYVNYYKSLGYKVLYNTNLFRIKRLFKGKTTVFTGQSGAGKSTLINKLDKRLNLETGEISKALGRGRHTTRFVQLIELFGGKVVDTPGFSMIEFNGMTNEDIRDSFIEFKKYPCPFKDCMHLTEKECRVKKEVENNNILESRYEDYKKFISGR